MEKRGALQISFAWLFAIIVGAIILFLAIFGTVKLIQTEQTTQDAKTGKEIEVLLNPLETSFEEGKTTSLTLPVDTRIYNKCNNNGGFGKQIIQISQKSFNKWTETNINVGSENKYLFSEEYVEGRKFYLFSKPFEFPFKIADLIYITPSLQEYCFIDAPEEVEEELSTLAQENLLLGNCSNFKEAIKVCFGSGKECDILVNYYNEYVEKSEGKMYFKGDALMYAAIFSDKEIYECQLERLMKRVGQLALLYENKANFILQTTGCQSNLDLLGLRELTNKLESSANLNSIYPLVEKIKEENEDNSLCRLW